MAHRRAAALHPQPKFRFAIRFQPARAHSGIYFQLARLLLGRMIILIIGAMKLAGKKLRSLFIYFAVLRPSFLIAFIIVYLPLTAAGNWVPGNSMLANLFADYDFLKAFWFAFALSGAVWALMLTTCLMLDFARDRQDQQGSK